MNDAANDHVNDPANDPVNDAVKTDITIYGVSDIRKVYHQHHIKPGSVLYSTDGSMWQSVPMDSGKWHEREWKFAFIL